MSKLRYLTLPTGVHMPSLGLGTFHAVDKDALQSTVDQALHVGYRHIDTAYSYGNEAFIGDVLRLALNAGRIRRNELFLTTKIKSDRFGSEAVIRETFEESLDRLKLLHVDMLLVHKLPWDARLSRELNGSVDASEITGSAVARGWKCFEQFFRDGSAKGVGVSNFPIRHLERLLSGAKVKPMNVQLECHAYQQQAQLRAYCKALNITVTGYSPLGAPARPEIHVQDGDLVLLDDPVVNEIAKQLGRTPAQVLLSFLLHLGVAPLVKTLTVHRLIDNFNIYDFQIPDEMFQKLVALNKNMKYYRFTSAMDNPEYLTMLRREAF